MKTFEEFVKEIDPTFLEGEGKCCDDKDDKGDKGDGKKKFSFFKKKDKPEAKEDDGEEKDDKKPFPAKKNPFLKGKKDKKED